MRRREADEVIRAAALIEPKLESAVYAEQNWSAILHQKNVKCKGTKAAYHVISRTNENACLDL